MRVCYHKDSLPFIFRNAAGKLVGFDVEMLQRLAQYMDVSLEYYPLGHMRENVEQELNAGICDIIVPGSAISPGRTQRLGFSVPHMELTLAFIVEDHRRDDFTSWQAVRELKAPKIGLATRSQYYRSLVQALVPRATIVPLDSPRTFFRKQGEPLDALVQGAESGSAWTRVYPQYTVAVPMPRPVAIPIAYVLPHGKHEMATFMDMWIGLKQKDRTLDDIFDHWILGKAAQGTEPRWSVVHNVLHWVD